MKNSINQVLRVSDKRFLIKEQLYDAPGENVDLVEADLQTAFMNMLLDEGLITDSVHSAAIRKIHKGV